MAITKAMLARCQNELKQAFCALPDDVQKAICADRENAQRLVQEFRGPCLFKRVNLSDPNDFAEHPWRLSPDTPTEPEWEEREVVDGGDVYLAGTHLYGCIVPGVETWRTVSDCVCHKRFIGVKYAINGIETLRTSVDAAFGVPVRVRFSK